MGNCFELPMEDWRNTICRLSALGQSGFMATGDPGEDVVWQIRYRHGFVDVWADWQDTGGEG